MIQYSQEYTKHLPCGQVQRTTAGPRVEEIYLNLRKRTRLRGITPKEPIPKYRAESKNRSPKAKKVQPANQTLDRLGAGEPKGL